jgi:hypothetical protein
VAAIIQVWTAPSCQTGAECLGVLAPWQSCSGSESDDSPSQLRVAVPYDVAAASGVAEGRILRVRSAARGEQWWFVHTVSDSDGDSGVVQISAGNIRQLLSVRGLVRSGGTATQLFRFATGKQTITALLNTYVLTNLSEDGLSWLQLGTVDLSTLVEIGTIDRASRGTVLDLIERQSGQYVSVVPVFVGGLLSAFSINVLSDPASTLETVPLSSGAQIETIQRTCEALRAATVTVPFDASGRPMDQCVWRVNSITGGGPAWVELRDPTTGRPFPIREDDQLNGYLLQERDGTQTTINDSRSSDSAVNIATVPGTLGVNDLVTVVTAGAVRGPHEITSPSGLTSNRGRLVATVATQQADSRWNMVANSPVSSWSSITAPVDYTLVGTGAGHELAQYPRTTPLTFSATISDAIVSGVGYTTLNFSGAVPFSRLFRLERILITYLGNTWEKTQATAIIASASGTGAVTFTTAQNFGMNIPAGLATVQLAPDGSSFLSYLQRPASFPNDGEAQGTNVMHLGGTWAARSSGILAASPRVENTAVRVFFDSARPYLHAAAAYTAREFGNNSLGPGSAPSANTPGVAIIEDTGGSGTVLASSFYAGTFAARETVSMDVTCRATLTGTVTVKMAFYPAEYQTPTGSNGTAITFLRHASLWLSASETDSMALQVNSGANDLWHRAQDVLENAGSGTRYVIKGVDLDNLQAETGTLALGQKVRLRSDRLGVDATVRVVKLDYVYSEAEQLQIELGAIAPRLTGVTVSL